MEGIPVYERWPRSDARFSRLLARVRWPARALSVGPQRRSSTPRWPSRRVESRRGESRRARDRQSATVDAPTWRRAPATGGLQRGILEPTYPRVAAPPSSFFPAPIQHSARRGDRSCSLHLGPSDWLKIHSRRNVIGGNALIRKNTLETLTRVYVVYTHDEASSNAMPDCTAAAHEPCTVIEHSSCWAIEPCCWCE
jgi:hypothetical protein